MEPRGTSKLPLYYLLDYGAGHIAVSCAAEYKGVSYFSQLQVAVLNPDNDLHMVAYLRGSSFGEYFGASLATGDLNKDGLDDLIVGAPHWKNDNGRVYIYLGTKVNYPSLYES